MANARDVTLDLVGRDKTRAATNTAANNFDRLQRKVDAANRKIAKRTGLMGKAFGALGSIRGGPIGVAAAALGWFTVSAVKGAARAEQSIGGVQAVFKSYFRLVEKQSERAADKYGISAQSYQDSAALIGASLKNQGVATWKLAGLTDKYIKRGVDLAATYGGTATEAVEAFTSALKGEFDPLERYGISIKQSILNTEAFRVAKVKTAAEWDKLPTKIKKAAAQQGLWNIIQKQSTDAEGQANRERDTTASKWQRFTALISDLRTQIASVFLPAVNAGLDGVIRWVKWMSSHRAEAAQFFVDLAVRAIEGFQKLLAGFKAMGQSILAGLVVMVESWNELPFVKKIDTGKLKSYSVSFGHAVDGWIGKLDTYKVAINNLPKIAKLKGDIKDLETKIAAAKVKLKSVRDAKTRAKIEADIERWKTQLAKVRSDIKAVDGSHATVHIDTVKTTFLAKGQGAPPHRSGPVASAWGGGDSWEGATSGRYRIEPPRVVMGDTTNITRVFLDSREIRSVARTAVLDEKRRSAFAARVGRR